MEGSLEVAACIAAVFSFGFAVSGDYINRCSCPPPVGD